MKRLGRIVVVSLVVLGGLLLFWRTQGPPEVDPEKTGPGSAPRDPQARLNARSQNLAARGLGPADVATLSVRLEPDAVGGARLQGLVLDEQESPVAGATVFLDANPPRAERTGRDGTFLFEGLVPRSYQVEALAESLRAGPVSVWLRDGTEPLVLHLHRATSLEVHVVEAAAGRDLAGAAVEARERQPRTVLADARGVARLHGLTPGPQVLKVSAPGFAPVWQPLTVSEPTLEPQRVRVALEPGGAASGTVVDGEGTPVAGVTVTPEPASPRPLTDERWDGVTTDAAGRWRFEHLRAGLYRFVASSARQAPGTSRHVTLEGEREARDITIQLPGSARLSGQVVDGQGAPVPQAQVRVVLDAGGRDALARQVTADARGHFALEGLPQRRLAVVALHERATSTTRHVDLSASAPAPEPLVLVLDATGVLRGRVVSASGEPVGEAVVLAELSSTRLRTRVEQTLRGALVTTADPGGSFELRGLVPGSYLLRAAAPGTSAQHKLPWLVAPVQAETAGAPVTLRLNLGGGLQGQVRHEDGSVPEDFSLVLRGAGSFPQASPTGQFVMEGLPAGEHTVYLSGPGFITKALSGVRIQERQRTDLGPVTVQRGRRISGRVVTERGGPVAGAVVSVSQPLKGAGVVAGSLAELEYGLRQATTQADGAFTLEGLAISPLQISAEHVAEGRSAFTPLPAGVADTQLELRLVATGQVEGVVRGAGQPLSGALVLITNPAAPAGGTSATTGTDGRFQFGNLTPGTYAVLATADSGSGQQVQRTTTQVQVGQTARVELEFPRGDVTVLVRAEPTPEPQAREARVILAAKADPGGGARPAQVQSLSLVEPARFSGVLPGDYQVCVTPLTTGTAPDGGTPAPTARCRPVTIAQQPLQQELRVAMPLP
ncbi:carboxypeptidase regulatory-like domain-containing protein [Melittangium boletus]|uniref:carboxypeptidase regulatory-like domain-containing protein n=1 Tax=Melittangium boletus TaxID=83453 RepID=UPI003DA3749E